MKSIIITARTLDEAITQACVELSVTSDMLDYEVMREGSSGFFGIGAKDYEIRATIKGAREKKKDAQAGKAKDKKKAAGADKKAAGEDKKKSAGEKDKKKSAGEKDKKAAVEKDKAAGKDKKKSAGETDKEAGGKKKDKAGSDKKDKDKKQAEPARKRAERVVLTEDPVERADGFLTEVFRCMGIDCERESRYDEDKAELRINLKGDGVGAVIGGRGETLDALQYLTGQVVNKRQTGFVRVKIDTEHYRERRQEKLEAYAGDLAQRARTSGRPMVLEPMNAYERRIVHSFIQGEEGVTTRSEGEEPYRHVVIVPEK